MAKSFHQEVRDGGPADERVVTYYAIPEAYGSAKKIGMRPLNSTEELDAARSAKFDVLKSNYEATKRMIHSIDGRRVSVADGSVDEFWEKADPRVRALLVTAYTRSAGPTRKEEEDFFKSATSTV